MTLKVKAPNMKIVEFANSIDSDELHHISLHVYCLLSCLRIFSSLDKTFLCSIAEVNYPIALRMAKTL